MFKVGDTVEVVIEDTFRRGLVERGNRATVVNVEEWGVELHFPQYNINQIVSSSLSHHIKLVETKETLKEEIKDTSTPTIIFEIGDKVALPTSKSYYGRENIEKTNVYKRAKENKQDYLYIVDIHKADSIDGYTQDCYVLDTEKDTNDGDFYTIKDLKPYIEKINMTCETLKTKKVNSKPILYREYSTHRISYLVNEPYVIVFITDKITNKKVKGVARCTTDDKFNVVKGIQIALTRAQIKNTEFYLKQMKKDLKKLCE